MTDAAESLTAVLDDLAVELPAIDRSTASDTGTTIWAVAGRPFALAAGPTVELRLDEAVAAAALKTPDTEPSAQGAEWVRYTPATLADEDLDRLEAWFALAHRRATAPDANAR